MNTKTQCVASRVNTHHIRNQSCEPVHTCSLTRAFVVPWSKPLCIFVTPKCLLFVNSEGLDKMPHYAAFQKQFYVEIITCNYSVYTMDHPKFIASNQKEESISS